VLFSNWWLNNFSTGNNPIADGWCYTRESSCKTESSEKVKDFVKLNQAGIPPALLFMHFTRQGLT